MQKRRSTVPGETSFFWQLFSFFPLISQIRLASKQDSLAVLPARWLTEVIDYMNVMRKMFSYNMAFNALPNTLVSDHDLHLSTELLSISVHSYYLWNSFYFAWQGATSLISSNPCISHPNTRKFILLFGQSFKREFYTHECLRSLCVSGSLSKLLGLLCHGRVEQRADCEW